MYSFNQLLAVALLFGVFAPGSASAQITLTNDNFPRPDAYVDTAYVLSRTSVPQPAEGEAVDWDYSDLEFDSAITRQFFAGENPLMPIASSFEESQTEYSAFLANSQYWSGQDAAGFSAEFGFTLEDTTFSLTPLTGGADDNLHIIGGTYPHTNRGTSTLIFPATFGTQWTSSYVQSNPYDITVAAFGLNTVPGTIESTFTTDREVTGYGRVRLPAVGDGPEPFYDALLVRLTRVRIDSIFLGGAPAPAALLAAFMTTQGATELDTAYVLYGLGDLGLPLLNYNLSSDDAVFRRIPGGNLTSTRQLRLLESNVYPNPVATGGRLMLDVPAGIPAGAQLQLVGVDGRLALQQPLNTVQASHLEVPLPVGLPGSSYVYVVRDVSGRILVSGKLEIR